jgi:Iron-containing redox enzyme
MARPVLTERRGAALQRRATTIEGQPIMNDLVFDLDREANALISSLDRHPVAGALFEGTIGVHHYASYLEQTAYYVGVSEHLLRSSGERLSATGRHPELARLLIEKSREERGHEDWARNDRRALGIRAGGSTPNAAVRAYIAYHRFQTESGAGAAFLGTAYVLEALSARRAPSAVRNLLASRRIPAIEGAVSFLREHGDADQDHIASLAAILRGFSDPEEIEAILHSARSTRLFFPGFFANAN